MPLSPDLPGSSKAALCVGPRAGAGPKGRALHRSLGGVGERRGNIRPASETVDSHRGNGPKASLTTGRNR